MKHRVANIFILCCSLIWVGKVCPAEEPIEDSYDWKVARDAFLNEEENDVEARESGTYSSRLLADIADPRDLAWAQFKLPPDQYKELKEEVEDNGESFTPGTPKDPISDYFEEVLFFVEDRKEHEIFPRSRHRVITYDYFTPDEEIAICPTTQFYEDMKYYGKAAIPYLLKYMNDPRIVYFIEMAPPDSSRRTDITLGRLCRETFAYLFDVDMPPRLYCYENSPHASNPFRDNKTERGADYRRPYFDVRHTDFRAWWKKHQNQPVEEIQKGILLWYLTREKKLAEAEDKTVIDNKRVIEYLEMRLKNYTKPPQKQRAKG